MTCRLGCRSQTSRDASCHAGAQSGVATDNDSRNASSSRHGTKGEACSGVASHGHTVASSLADPVGQRASGSVREQCHRNQSHQEAHADRDEGSHLLGAQEKCAGMRERGVTLSATSRWHGVPAERISECFSNTLLVFMCWSIYAVACSHEDCSESVRAIRLSSRLSPMHE